MYAAAGRVISSIASPWKTVHVVWLTCMVMVVFFTLDAIGAVMWNINRQPPKLSIYARILFEGAAVMSFFVRKKMSWQELSSMAFFFVGIFCAAIGEMAFEERCPYADSMAAFYTANKYYYVFVVIYFWGFVCANIDSRGMRMICLIYEATIVLMASSVLIGFALDLSVLKSYADEARFGYKGLMPLANDASMYWIIAMFYGINEYAKRNRKFILIVSALSAMIIGTKALWLLTPILLITGIWHKVKFGGKVALALAVAGALGVATIQFIEILQSLSRLGRFNSVIEPIIAFMNGDDVMPSLSSGRFSVSGESLSDNFQRNISYWVDINYIFGGQYVGTEMDVFDTFAALGGCGVAILLGAYGYIFSRFDRLNFVFAAVFMALAILSGHVMQNAMNVFYLLLVSHQSTVREKDTITKLQGVACA